MQRRLILFPEGALYIGPVQDNDLHSHPAIQIVLSAHFFDIRIEDQTYRTKHILIPSNIQHQLKAEQSAWLLLLHPETSLAESLNLPESPDLKIYPADMASPSDLPFSRTPTTSDVMKAGDLYGTILDILELGNFASAASLKELSKPEPRRTFPDLEDSAKRSSHPGVRRALAFLQNHPDLKVKLADVAFHAGLSESRLAHVFKDHMGLPLRRFILWLRLQRAVLTVQAGGSLTDAAHSAGFSDQAHFSRTFRQSFGLSPRQALSQNISVEFISS
ncbi:MAG: helix-turn-helix transcriptional regulator [Leptospiraceae bacterium]|nr:helix-turn-helix transcriptional regulator [Leptospiraceae bacterium]